MSGQIVVLLAVWIAAVVDSRRYSQLSEDDFLFYSVPPNFRLCGKNVSAEMRR